MSVLANYKSHDKIYELQKTAFNFIKGISIEVAPLEMAKSEMFLIANHMLGPSYILLITLFLSRFNTNKKKKVLKLKVSTTKKSRNFFTQNYVQSFLFTVPKQHIWY
jgi:hypothetical protein